MATNNKPKKFSEYFEELKKKQQKIQSIKAQINNLNGDIPKFLDISSEINDVENIEKIKVKLQELKDKYNRYDEAILLKEDIDGGKKNLDNLSDDEQNLLNEFDLKNKSHTMLVEEKNKLSEAINLLKKIKDSNRINKEYNVESKDLNDLEEELKKAEESLKVKDKLIKKETLDPDELNLKNEEDLENKEINEIESSIEDLKIAIKIKEESDYFKKLEEEKAEYPEFELNKNSKEIELDNEMKKLLSDKYNHILKKYKVEINNVNNIDDLKNLISEKLQKLKDENKKLQQSDLIEVKEELKYFREILNAHPLMKEVRFEKDIKHFEKSIKKSNDNIKELKKLLDDKILKFKNYGQFNDIKDLANKVENGYGLIKDDQEYNELFEKINEFNNEIIRIDQELKDSNLSKVQKDNLEGEKKGIQNNFCKYSRKWIKYLKTYIKREIEILPKVALNYEKAIEVRKNKLYALTNKKSDDQPNKDPNADDADKDKDKDEDKDKETSGYKLPIKKKEPGFWSKMFSGIKEKWKKRKENKLEKKKAKEKSKGKDEDKDKDKEQKLDDNSLLNNKIDDSNSNVKFENEDKPLTKDYMEKIFSNINEEGSEYNPKYLEQYKREVEILRQKQIKEEEKEKAEQGRSI